MFFGVFGFLASRRKTGNAKCWVPRPDPSAEPRRLFWYRPYPRGGRPPRGPISPETSPRWLAAPRPTTSTSEQEGRQVRNVDK